MAVIERDHYPDNALNKLDTALNDIEKLKRTASTAGITTSDVSALIAAHAADAEAHHATIPDATETVKGIAELATTTEAQTGTATTLIVTPAGLRADVPTTPAASRGVRLNASGHLIMPATGDIRPFNIGYGLGQRSIQGSYTPDLHFTSGSSAPTGYAWAGSPFAAPDTVYYSYSSDFLFCASGTNARNFLYRSITNNAANWSNKSILGAFAAVGVNTRYGLRIDDGTDNNYVEMYVDGTANDATETVKFEYTGGTIVTTNISVPVGTLFVLRLYCIANTAIGGYLYMPSTGLTANVAGFYTAIAWAPAAGRAGIFAQNPTGSAANGGACDWLLNEFV